MSFALTKQQIKAGTKTVTRRMGWKFAPEGMLIQPVEKCMGLRKGEKIIQIRGPIIVKSIRREQLRLMILDQEYGERECIKEGFPELTPTEFVEMFCDNHKGCQRWMEITRIEFGYTD